MAFWVFIPDCIQFPCRFINGIASAYSCLRRSFPDDLQGYEILTFPMTLLLIFYVFMKKNPVETGLIWPILGVGLVEFEDNGTYLLPVLGGELFVYLLRGGVLAALVECAGQAEFDD